MESLKHTQCNDIFETQKCNINLQLKPSESLYTKLLQITSDQ